MFKRVCEKEVTGCLVSKQDHLILPSVHPREDMSLQRPQCVVDEHKSKQAWLNAILELLLVELVDGEVKKGLLLSFNEGSGSHNVLLGAVFMLDPRVHHHGFKSLQEGRRTEAHSDCTHSTYSQQRACDDKY